MRLPVRCADFFQPRLQFFRTLARLSDTGEVAFHIGHKYRNADFRERFRQLLQRDGFTGPRGAGN